MTIVRTLALGTMSAGLLSGCVAAVVPLAAAGAIGKTQVGRRHRPDRTLAQSVPAPVPTPVQPIVSPLPQPQPPAQPLPTSSAPVAADMPAGMQYLYGSGEAAALSLQSYQQLASFLLARQSDRQIGNPIYSVVLAPNATLAKPVFEQCGNKPLAIVLDVDETVLLNEGFEADQVRNGGRFDSARWDEWERTGVTQLAPVPGVADALAMARKAGIKVIFNSNRAAANAAGTAAALDRAGLGPAVHGDSLWLKGDAAGGDGKDARRWAISAKYCVVAMVGDQLGDFTDLFNPPATTIAARRALVAGDELRTLWGQGWFMLPNPVYGSALKGGMNDVFAPQMLWTSPTPSAEPVPVQQEK